MNKSKIEWCDMTWNPVTGCYHGCEYCYARKIAKRFSGKYVLESLQNNVLLSDKAAKYICSPKLKDGRILMAQHRPVFKNIGILDIDGKRYSPYPFGFCPTLHTQHLVDPSKVKKPQNIFVCSMADLFGDWVPNDWIKEVFRACEKAPQHNYLFLTKNPLGIRSPFHSFFHENKNAWIGTSITKKPDMKRLEHLVDETTEDTNRFVSIEPLIEYLGLILELRYNFKWVIIGQETGNRKEKIIPKDEWVQDIIDQCREWDVPVFIKSPLYEKFPIQEYPKGLKTK